MNFMHMQHPGKFNSQRELCHSTVTGWVTQYRQNPAVFKAPVTSTGACGRPRALTPEAFTLAKGVIMEMVLSGLPVSYDSTWRGFVFGD